MNEDNIFYKRLKLLSNSINKSINQVEKDLCYPRNSLNNYKTKINPSGIRLLEISEYFHVSPKYLLGKSDIKEDNSVEEIFQDLDESQKQELFEVVLEWTIKKRKNK